MTVKPRLLLWMPYYRLDQMDKRLMISIMKLEQNIQSVLMADCSTVDEMIHADELGFDFIGSTLVGYTKQK